MAWNSDHPDPRHQRFHRIYEHHGDRSRGPHHNGAARTHCRLDETDFTLAEIEGDAVLFYRKGEPLRREQLIGQCLRMFSNFHRQLMVIERDTVCQCGACQTASNLTLKFIAHFGYIKEIKVAQFVKATGIDMIVAHQLLKNDVGSDGVHSHYRTVL